MFVTNVGTVFVQYGDSAILIAADKSSTDTVKLLISHGASIHDKNNVLSDMTHFIYASLVCNGLCDYLLFTNCRKTRTYCFALPTEAILRL